MALKGRCRTCKSKMSWQYPIVELTTAILFLAIYSIDGLSVALIFDLVIVSLLIVMTVYDIKHKIIPDGLVVLLVLFGLAKMLSPLFYGGAFSLLNFLAGFIFFIPFYYITISTYVLYIFTF